MGSAVLFTAVTFLITHCVMSLAFPVQDISTDKSALMVLKSHLSFGADNIVLEKNWTAESSVCSWKGVVCDASVNRVSSLNISKMGLIGTIPPHLGNLSFLNYLDLSHNFLHGDFPEGIGQLPRLEYLDLRNNSFRGVISPSIFSSLSNLRSLCLSNNTFSGSIPSSISNMSKLEILVLSGNMLTGNIPREIADLHSLTVLSLHSNQLSGPIPLGFFNLSLLKVLVLNKNEFDGPIPAYSYGSAELEVLSLSFNAFTGKIPREIGNLSMLVHLDIGDNHLTGSIPTEIGNLRRLETLSLDDNLLSGSIPASVFNISTLEHISCPGNKLSGNLPTNLGSGTPNLMNLILSDNILMGTIPNSISNATKLTTLSLADNGFTDLMPETLGNLRSLQHLFLGGNKLKIKPSSSELSIITALTNCRNLVQVWIGQNPLYGVLPASIGNFSTSVTLFDASGCKIMGPIPAEIGNLSTTLKIDLSHNDLTGFIPKTVKGLIRIQQLFLNDNRIGGTIPDTICNLQQLGDLYLGRNQISGPVPSCIGNITSLREVYVDSNNFSSGLPPSLWKLKDLVMFNASANSLTGHLPPEIANLKVITSIDLSVNRFTGNIPTTIGKLEKLTHLSLGQNELEGSIPDSFCKIPTLELLDLSQNKLTGEIPQSLEALRDLKLFNVSFNRLSGLIPSEGPFQNFTGSSFMSNAALCGDSRFEVPPCPIIHSNRRTRLIMLIFLVIFPTFLASIFMAILLIRCRMKKRAAVQNVTSPDIKHKSISYHELVTVTNRFNEGNLLARGSYSTFYECILNDGTHSAAKVFNLKIARARVTFHTECDILSKIRHRNLIEFIASCTLRDLDIGAIVLEYMPNGSLERWLYSHNYCLGILQRLDIMIDVASALDYLHNNYYFPVVHCDVKPGNVLLDKGMVGHLCDFGIAKILSVRDGVECTKTIGTVGYIAPEYGIEGLVSTKCDVYSYGIMLMETFTRRKPSDNMFTGDITLRSWIEDSFPDEIVQIVDRNLFNPDEQESDFEAKMQCVSSIMELALQCTATTPGERMNMQDVVPILKKLRSLLITQNCDRNLKSDRHKSIP